MLALDKLFCVRNNKSIDIVCSVLQKTLWLYTLGNHWREPDSSILWEAVDHIIHLLFIMDTRKTSNASLCGYVKYHRKMLTFINHILIFLWDINFKFNRDMKYKCPWLFCNIWYISFDRISSGIFCLTSFNWTIGIAFIIR